MEIGEPGYMVDRPAKHHSKSAQRTKTGVSWELRSKITGPP